LASFEKRDVLVLIGGLPAQAGQLVPFGSGERLIAVSLRCVQASPLISDPPVERLAYFRAEN
jgi:hypothetical protein